ncbi:MAG: type II toxin-antitoxin system ParD family antitoxin [Bacteroidota bacterium]|nr:type II toxin-antitoxin system ParD family antitoxin [Bacteroidota bacterium]
MAKNTSILLGNHFDDFITDEIDSGRYSSASEVVRSALRLLESEEQKLTQLRKDLELGENNMIIKKFDSKKHLLGLHKKHL